MAKLLSGSVVWRIFCAIGAWLASLARGSRLNAAIALAWKHARLRGWLLRRLDAPDAWTQAAWTTLRAQRLNDRLARCFVLRRAWRSSLLRRILCAIARCGRESRLLGWLFRRGVTGLILTLLGVYVLIDYTLREALTVPLLSSVWDELLILLALFWIVWSRMGRERPLRARANPLDLPVFSFFCIGFALMCAVGSYPSIQIAGYRATVQYILWFFLCTRLLRDERDFTWLYTLLCVVAFVLALHGIYQYIIGVPMPSHWMSKAETAVRTRIFSIFGSPNIMGDFMVMFVPMTAALAYYTKKAPVKALAWLAAIVMCFACLFTMSRGAWVGMAISIVLFILLVDRRLFWLLLAAGALLMFVPFVRTRIGFLFTDEFVAASNNGGRSERWATGLALLKASNPWLGYGLGMFGGAIAMQTKIMDWIEYFYMDNYYLKILVEMGYVGLASFAVMMLSLVVTGSRTLRRVRAEKRQLAGTLYPLCAGIFAGLCGVLAHCLFENIFEQPYMMVYFWTLAAMLVWAGFLRRPSASSPAGKEI